MKTLTTLALGTAFLACSAWADTLSMSDADKALYSADENPGDLYIAKGEETFKKVVGKPADLAIFLGVEPKMLGKEIATFPKFFPKANMVIGLDQMLQLYMDTKGQKAFKLSSNEMVEMSSYVKSLANDEKVAIMMNDAKVASMHKLGEELYNTRRGARGLSCNSCHSQGVLGMRLRMQELPNLGAPTIKSGATWPAYRMTKSELTTMQKRFQGCMENSSQAKLPLGSKEMVALEVYVSSLANGQTIAIPGLKR